LKAESVVIAATILVLICITAIDWIVHSMLYQYGLTFSYDWANPYWFFLNATFASIGLLAASTYWLYRKPDLRNAFTAGLIFWTVFLQVFGYNLDVLWYLIDYFLRGRAFDLTKVWGWGPVDWFTKIVFHRAATALDAVWCSAVLNAVTLALWLSSKFLRHKFSEMEARVFNEHSIA